MSLTVRLAGFNVDADLLRETAELLGLIERESGPLAGGGASESRAWLESLGERIRTHLSPEAFTPETLSAAYARISRDPKPVTDLRKAARAGVARSRKSNETIIFGLGHASVAEHACFNLDVLGLSRLAAEALQAHRLASFTEKSQRYISLSTDYVIPSEVLGSPWEDKFRTVIPQLFSRYDRLCEVLQERALATAGGAPESKDEQREIENAAKEDARYLLPLACATQMGVTMNARTLEHVSRDLSDHPLAEVRDLGRALRQAVEGLAPSLVKYTTRGRYPRASRAEFEQRHTVVAATSADARFHAGPTARLIESSPDAERQVLKALAFSAGREPGPDVPARDIWARLLRDMTAHDSPPREFELAQLTFEAELSASCFAQLKRHRMMTLLAQPYRIDDGMILPPSVRAAGQAAEFEAIAGENLEQARRLARDWPQLTPYLLLNAHRRRVLVRMNARELYHFARLRCDRHAQWEIRDLATQMLAQGQERWPHMLALACGKDAFAETYARFISGG